MPSPTHFPASRLRPTALACTSLILGVMLSGCGGGSSGDAVTQTDSGYQVASGVAQKGPLARGSWISINELNPNTLAPVGTSFNFEIRDDLGTFQPDSTVFTRPLLESTAMGYYFDELTGKVSTDVVILRGMSDLAVDRAVNINLLTDLANARTRALMTRTTSPLKFAAARAQAQREVLQALFLFNSSDLLPGGTTEPASFGELDLSKNRNADQVLAALSAVVTQIGVTGGGINQFINQFEADLLDDGLINNSPRFASSLTTKLNTAFKTVDFAKLAANLNTFYGTTRYTAASLSQWVDTSGGVDKVINRYKSTDKDFPTGTESKSVEYVAGTNDAGQCISSSTGTLYRNGVEVTTGTVKAVKGDKYALGFMGTTATSINGFIQRTATSAGLCPATKPTAGITRITKHTANFIETSNPNAILEVAIVRELFYTTTCENLFIEYQSREMPYALTKNGQILAWKKTGAIYQVTQNQNIKNIFPNYDSLRIKMIDGSYFDLKYLHDTDTNSITPPEQGAITKNCQLTSYTGNKFIIKTDGSVWTSGPNTYGQLGDGTTSSSETLKNIGVDYKKIIPLDSGLLSTFYSMLGLKSDGSLWGWGLNNNGQLGDGTTTNVLSPKKIDSGYSRIDIRKTASSTGGSWLIIGLKTDGSLWTWGTDNSSGALGIGSTNSAKTPQKIGENYESYRPINEQAAFIAKKADGTLWVWGKGIGYLAGKPEINLPTPTQINPEFTSIYTYKNITIGTKKDGSTWGWSRNNFSLLGDGTQTPSTTTPKQIDGNYTQLIECSEQIFAIKSDTTLWTWGGTPPDEEYLNYYENNTPIATFTRKLIGTGFKSIPTCGLALKYDGTLWGWGAYDDLNFGNTPRKLR